MYVGLRVLVSYRYDGGWVPTGTGTGVFGAGAGALGPKLSFQGEHVWGLYLKRECSCGSKITTNTVVRGSGLCPGQPTSGLPGSGSAQKAHVPETQSF